MFVENLTPKQRIFCNEYLIDMNATRAYRKAYPNIKKDETAGAAASRLLGKVNVKRYIEEQLEKIEDKSIADAIEVMKYLTKVLRGEEVEEMIVVEGIGDGCSEARRMNKALNQKDRIKAAELLGKRYSLFTDKVEANVQQQVVFTDEAKLED